MFYEVEWFKEEVGEFWKERMNKFLWKKRVRLEEWVGRKWRNKEGWSKEVREK